jgi:hypothetical protein
MSGPDDAALAANRERLIRHLFGLLNDREAAARWCANRKYTPVESGTGQQVDLAGLTTTSAGDMAMAACHAGPTAGSAEPTDFVQCLPVRGPFHISRERTHLERCAEPFPFEPGPVSRPVPKRERTR